MYTYTHTYAHIHTRVGKRMCTDMYIIISLFIYILIYTCVNIVRDDRYAWRARMYVYTRTYAMISLYIRARFNYTRIYACCNVCAACGAR